jgi:hypothetical protein
VVQLDGSGDGRKAAVGENDQFPSTKDQLSSND